MARGLGGSTERDEPWKSSSGPGRAGEEGGVSWSIGDPGELAAEPGLVAGVWLGAFLPPTAFFSSLKLEIMTKADCWKRQHPTRSIKALNA